jgi:putative metalloprotease
LTNAQFSQHEERQADRYGLTFLKVEGYDKNPAISALEKLAVLASGHTFLSSHPDPQARAELLMQGEDRGVEDAEHIWTTLFKYAQTVCTKILELLRSLVTGLLAFR